MGILKETGSRLTSGEGWLGRAFGAAVGWYEGRHGPVYAQRKHKTAQVAGRSIRRGLAEIAARWPDVASPSQESPVFILSAGWRSGSTLLQRLVMSRESILVWGEPYSHARMLHHLSAGISAITPDWPEDEWFVDRYPVDELSTRFVANMYPNVQDLLEACLACTRTLLAEPAYQRGFSRWGLKDVRLTIEDAFFLRWLYPQARFVFLCRNPYAAYRSYRADRSWYNEWPDDPVFTAARFGQHWRGLVEGFREGHSEIGGMFVRYEDLCEGGTGIAALEEYLQLDIDIRLLERKVGTQRREGDNGVPVPELRRLRKEVAPVASALAYEP